MSGSSFLQPIKTMLERRETHIQAHGNGESSNSGSGGGGGSGASPASPTRGAEQPRMARSVYREIMYLTLVSLGQDNIDLTAFDREYRRAFSRLPDKHAAMARACDRPPSVNIIFCRKLFRELKL